MKIYNSLTRKKDTFEPKNGEVRMYVCGPTVYDEPHIGHARAAYIFEVIRNYFEYRGFKVKFVKNITDVDDKIIAKAKEELPNTEINEAVKKIAERYTQKYYEDMDALEIRRATKEPKATEYIDKMQKYIAALIKKGFAYESEQNVYFDVRKFKKYGELSHQNLDQIRSSVRIEKDEKKKDALDFALWKKAKEGEPSWNSSWGKGRPGWHIECSVMSSKILGDEFDIHGGGRDLIFPHHENEIAQSQAYSGKKFAKVWMHNGLLTINGQKMAKSLGNFISIKDFLKEYEYPNILKFFFLSTHYRNPIDYTKKRIEEARKTNNELLELLVKAQDIFNSKTFEEKKVIEKGSKKTNIKNIFINYEDKFTNAMNDDFHTPRVLSVLHEILDYHKTITNHPKIAKHNVSLQTLFYGCYTLLPKIAKIFGLDLNIPAEMNKKLDEETEELIKKRDEARKKGNFKLGDKIRRELLEKGIILEDTKEGTSWRRKI